MNNDEINQAIFKLAHPGKCWHTHWIKTSAIFGHCADCNEPLEIMGEHNPDYCSSIVRCIQVLKGFRFSQRMIFDKIFWSMKPYDKVSPRNISFLLMVPPSQIALCLMMTLKEKE